MYRWRTASTEEPGLAPEMKLWLTLGVQVQSVVWEGFDQADTSETDLISLSSHGKRNCPFWVSMMDPLPMDYKTDLQKLMASG